VLVRSKAPNRVMILDTCAVGRFVSGLGPERQAGSEQERALERMKDRSGTLVLAGSAADKVSYEATRFGHGVLTYCVLESIVSGEGLRSNNIIDAVRGGAVRA
jgi:uncharacterized caspase-like protein